MSQLVTQKRLAMSLFGVGQRKVWLDPAKTKIIQKAKSRQDIRNLIGQDIIQVIPSHRGKRDRLTPILQSNHSRLQRIKKEWAVAQNAVREAEGTQATSLSGGSIDEASAQSLALKAYYYEVLGVSRTASSKEIASAYRQKAKQWHPDMNKSPQAKEHFQAIQVAYSTLKDPKKRKEYDYIHTKVYASTTDAGGDRTPGYNQNQTSRRSQGSSRFWYLVAIVAVAAIWYRWNTFVPATEATEEEDYVRNPRLFNEARKAKAKAEASDNTSESSS